MFPAAASLLPYLVAPYAMQSADGIVFTSKLYIDFKSPKLSWKAFYVFKKKTVLRERESFAYNLCIFCFPPRTRSLIITKWLCCFHLDKICDACLYHVLLHLFTPHRMFLFPNACHLLSKWITHVAYGCLRRLNPIAACDTAKCFVEWNWTEACFQLSTHKDTLILMSLHSRLFKDMFVATECSSQNVLAIMLSARPIWRKWIFTISFRFSMFEVY